MARMVLLATAVVFMGIGASVAEDKPVLDRDFLLKAVPRCHALVQYAELADKRAGNAEVKEFGAKLVKEHRRLHEDLSNAAADQKLAVVAGTEKGTREEVDRLSKLQGAEFDRMFLDRIIKEHEKGIAMCEAQEEQGKDAKLRAFAKGSLPALKDHLKEAKALAAKVK